MGLDWCLKDRLQEEHRERVDALMEALRDPATPEESRVSARQALRALLGEGLILAPLDALGARRLWADDPESVEAFQRVYASHQEAAREHPREEYRAYWLRPLEEVVRENEGSILVDTIPDENLEVIRHNLSNPFAHLAGFESFRGKRIQYCALVPDSLRRRAIRDHDPEEMREYADRLALHYDADLVDRYAPMEARMAQISEDRFIEVVPHEGCEEEYERLSKEIPSAYWDHRTVHEAVTWLRFWAGHGFSMWAWY